jgi:hypothetical protein
MFSRKIFVTNLKNVSISCDFPRSDYLYYTWHGMGRLASEWYGLAFKFKCRIWILQRVA